MNLLFSLREIWETSKTDEEKRAETLVVLKQYRTETLSAMKQKLYEERSGLPDMYFLSDKIDEMLSVLMHFVFFRIFPSDDDPLPCIVACGGYGRRELAPFSDIDLVFLMPENSSEEQRERILYVVYLLWDIGLKIGYTVRTPQECIDEARSDMTIRTNLLEARFVAGNETLFNDFLEKYGDLKTPEEIKAFVEAKKIERSERYKRMGQSRYMLEPNLKEGVGGLRDLHLLFWLMKYVFDITDMRELVWKGILPRKTVNLFLRAHAFLDTLRCCLHFYRGRRGDILTMDAQQAIAETLGYRDRKGGLSAVERMMKHYYIISKNVGALTRYFSAVVEDELSQTSCFETLEDEEGFCLINGRLAFKNEKPDNPSDLLRLFYLKQKLGVKIAPAALQCVAHQAKDIRFVRTKPPVREMFFSILLSPDSQDILHELLDTGVLGEMLPVFKPITGQMQFDMYHVYTTDEHTLKVVSFLEDFEKTPDAPFIQSKRALYVAALLHDVGKGAGGGHAEKGALFAQKTLIDLGLTESECDIVTWLIRNHLLMSETAFKRDIFDSKTIAAFIEKVESPEKLRLLYALTVADIKAVGPGVWNSFKEKLLSDLFKRTLEAMRGGSVDSRIVSAFQKDLVNAFYASDEDVCFCVRNDVLPEMTEFTVVTKDRAGLFSLICGAMAVVGVSIVGATVMTLDDGTVLDTFYVQDTDAALLENGVYGALTSERKTKRLKDKIRAALENEDVLSGEVEKKRLSSLQKPFYYPPRVRLDNNASDNCTLIEVDASDSVGFLYAVTSAMKKLALQIVSAHIYTYGTHVVDVFYVRGENGEKISGEERMQNVQTRILNVLELLT